MDRETRTLKTTIELRAEGDGLPKITGHASVFNVRSQIFPGFFEEVMPGAFVDTIKDDDIRALFGHDPNMVLGRNEAGTLTLREDKTGLVFELDPADTQIGRDAVTSIRRGDITGMSIGFSVKPGGMTFGEDDDGNTVRTLTNIRLFEISAVAFPAFEQTDVGVAKRSLAAWRAEQSPAYTPNIAPRIARHAKTRLSA